DGNTITGNAPWKYTNDSGSYTCYGETKVTATRVIRSAEIDVNGLWEGNWESFEIFFGGTFSASIIQNGSTLTGDIDIPWIGMYDAELKGTFDGIIITFGDIEDTIIFTGIVKEDLSAYGFYSYPESEDYGLWEAQNANAESNSLDFSFGSGGKVITESFSNVIDIDLQSDGKIVIIGNSSEGIYETIDFVLIRFNNDGSLDLDFGDYGYVVTDIEYNNNYANSLGIQSDGKIVVAGTVIDNEDNSDFVLTRYNTDGSLDLDFGNNGIAITDIEGNDNNASSLGIQSDGKIVVAGSVIIDEDNADFAIARYNTDGSLDLDFGNNGIVVTDIEGKDNNASSLGIQSDGKIVIAGSVVMDEDNADFAIARYNIDGSMDSTFGTDGIVTSDINSNDSIYDICIRSDGKIAATGYSDMSVLGLNFALVLYNNDGSIDSDFGTNGIVNRAIGYYFLNLGLGLGIDVQTDNKLVISGIGQSTWEVARFNPDGSLDATFGSDGIVNTDFVDFGGWDYSRDLIIQPDGKIIAAGIQGSINIALVRYLP
ncbi:MAG: delta-60 repeat domain-containing protein, partial [Spirochaetota bacterium]|nr:delta-60 repeat domain-containing protein [Spirochaetota bacterium]